MRDSHTYVEREDTGSGVATGMVLAIVAVLLIGIVALFLFFGGPGRFVGGTTNPNTAPNINIQQPPPQSQPAPNINVQPPSQPNPPPAPNVNVNPPAPANPAPPNPGGGGSTTMPFEGTGDKVSGKAREIKGRVTGDRREEAAGLAKQDRGEMKANVARTRRKVEGKVEEVKGRIKQKI
jgi:uncharacterized protein YjbJ (UPF0337 family)